MSQERVRSSSDSGDSEKCTIPITLFALAGSPYTLVPRKGLADFRVAPGDHANVHGQFRADSVSGNQMGMEPRKEKHAMLKTIALMGLGAAISFTSLPAIAQTNQSTTPAASAPAAAAPTGSHRSQLRHRANLSKERARASAHHMRQMQHKPATTP